jgi:HSP20 family molecular chaperone IbpA
MANRRGFGIDEFERAVDEFFDELLIERWKCGTQSGEFERARVIDQGDRYDVRIAALGVDPSKIQVEVSGQRLAVHLPDRFGGMLESAVSFSDSIDGEAAAARWSEGTLVVTVPKKKSQRIILKHS